MNKPQVLVLAAGMGSRYGGLKQIDPMGPNGEVLLDYSLYDAFRAGFERVIFVIRESFEEAFRDRFGKRIEERTETSYVFQNLDDLPDGYSVPEGREKPWGTAHALLCARDVIDAPFAVINADDFYGAEPYELLFDHLRDRPSDAEIPRYGLVGYPLHNTLSEHGTVSRGVCEVNDDGLLTEIVEREEIRPSNGDVEFKDENGNWTLIDPNTPVSMNSWGFTPTFLEQLQARFPSFLDRHGSELESEFLVPEVVNSLIQEGESEVVVYPTEANWFGVTYREDRETARREIRKRIEKGLYGEDLWAESQT